MKLLKYFCAQNISFNTCYFSNELVLDVKHTFVIFQICPEDNSSNMMEWK
jgi:hypothetical protein